MARYSHFHPAGEAAAGSPAYRLDARFKVLLLGVLSGAVWNLDTFAGLGMVWLLILIWIGMARGAGRTIFTALRRMLYLLLLIIAYYSWAEISRPGMAIIRGMEAALARSFLLAGKLAILLVAAYWLYLSTAPMKVVDALSSVLRPLERLRVPVRELAFTVGLIIRYFPSSLARIKDLYRNFQLREKLSPGREGPSGNKYLRAVMRVIDTMVLYMHYSLYESQLLSLSLLSRGYNPFRPVSLAASAKPGYRDYLFLAVSAAVIVLAAWRF